MTVTSSKPKKKVLRLDRAGRDRHAGLTCGLWWVRRVGCVALP